MSKGISPDRCGNPSGWTVLFLIAIGVMSFVLFYAPAIYSDDWSSFVKPMVDGNAPWLDWAARRPLEYAPRRLLSELFGLNVPISHIVLGTLNVLAAIQFYFLLLRFFPKKTVVASVSAAIFLVVPVDYTRTWLTMIHIRIVLCLLFLFAWLMSDYVEKGRPVALLGALFVLGFSLGMYEAQLGLALAWCVWLVLSERKIEWKRRIAVLSPFLFALLFAVWRTFGVTQAGISDSYLGEMQISPVVILGRLMLGFKVLVWGWTEPLRRAFGFNGNWLPMLLLLLSVAIFELGFFFLDRRRSSDAGFRFRGWQQFEEIRALVVLFGLGIVLIVAGYIPISFLYEPNLDGLVSRVNLFALPGASLALVSVLYGSALIMARHQRQVRLLLLAGSVPLIALGFLTQVWVQHDIRGAWVEQKQIWAEMFDLVPNLTDDTMVCFVLQGYQDRVGFANWRRTPLSANWEVAAALQVLYGNDSLWGEVLFPDLETHGEAILVEDGVINPWTGKKIPYDRALFVLYNGDTGHLSVVDDVQSELSVTWPTPTYAPYERITGSDSAESPPVEEQSPDLAWRWLVETSATANSSTD